MNWNGSGIELADASVDLWVSVHGSESLNQQCQRFTGYYEQWEAFGTESGIISYSSAKVAFQNSSVTTGDINSAPVGANVFWNIDPYWHVGRLVGYDGGRALVSYATELGDTYQSIGSGVKIAHGDSYPHTFAGWAPGNGQNAVITITGGGGGGGTDYGYGLSSECQLALQQAMTVQGYYNGAQDGEFGQASVSGMQQWLIDLGYLPASYVVDGVPGPTYGAALQTLAHEQGVPIYNGPIDGDPGDATSASLTGWAGTQMEIDYGYGLTSTAQEDLQRAMTKQSPPYYSGAVDGAFGQNSVSGMQQWLKDLGYLSSSYVVDGKPGPTYGKALQTLAHERGVPVYTGDIDGRPGTATSTSLSGWAKTTWTPDPDPDPDTVPETPTGTVFGVDISSSQATFDFDAFAAAGGKAVFIKAGGANVTGDSPYTTDHYAEHLAGARANGLSVGHYWFNGRADGVTPTSAAQYWAEHLDVADGDILALDVEDESATGTAHYTPDEVAEFIAALDEALPGVDLKVLLYMNASVESTDDWSAIVADGHPLWIASWGANDGQIPGDLPVPTHFEGWQVWQYSSRVTVPGWASPVDGNIVTETVFADYGYDSSDEPGPDPDPGTGADSPLRELLTSYLNESADLSHHYANEVAALPDGDEDVDVDRRWRQ